MRVQSIVKRPGMRAERVLMGTSRGAIARELGVEGYVCALEIPRAVLVEWDPAVGYDLLCLTPERQPARGPINFLRFGDREPIRAAVVWVARTVDGIPCSIDEPIARYLLAMIRQHAPLTDQEVTAS